jgi:hypothetical protein
MSVDFGGDGFNSEDVPPDSFSPLPEGSYTVIITDSEQKASKSGKGTYLKTTMQIVEGEFKGRKLWGTYNLAHENQQTVEIAKRQLADICAAVGVLRPRNSGELHNKPFMLDLKVEERKDSPGEFQNRIKKHRALVAGSGGPAAPQSHASNDGKPPWAR